MTPLAWHSTEFGRRTDCGTFRIVHTDAGWQLLDADWNAICQATRKIPESQQIAERIAAQKSSRKD